MDNDDEKGKGMGRYLDFAGRRKKLYENLPVSSQDMLT